LVVIKFAQVLAREHDAAGIDRIEPGDQVEQG